MCNAQTMEILRQLCLVIFRRNPAAIAVEAKAGKARLHDQPHPEYTQLVYEEGQEETVPDGPLVFWRRDLI
jgi:hypothetical protein